MKKLLTVLIIAVCSVCTHSWAQIFPISPIYYTEFDPDSLSGFEESAARQSVLNEGFHGSEFKVRLYDLKRDYIDKKYNIVRKRASASVIRNYLAAQRPAAVPGCVNEDFEASTPAQITTSTQIAGWTVTKGYNQNPSTASGANASVTPYYQGLPVAPPYNSCNATLFPVPPRHSELIDCSAPGGFLDGQIGTQYPIYSVFGSGAANAAATVLNPQITGGMSMFGTRVFRLNDGITSDYSMEKLSKTFAVTSSNALFQFAFISVFGPEHGCCEAGGFQIRLSDATSNTVIPCPNFSVSAPSSACTATVPVNYFVGSGSVPAAGTPYTNQTGVSVIYNRWKVNSIDLTSYIGQSITIDIIVSDCNAGGHYGKVYFDAQCGPMTVSGNGVSYDAGITNVVVPTCGAAGATICAAAGLGPYSWAGPGIPPNLATPSMTNQCFTSTISATYTLYMQPEGSCAPIARVVTSTITPAPLLVASALQATCGSTLAVISVTPSGSAANPSSISWSPNPLSLSTNSLVGSFQIPGGSTPLSVSITASDPLGCLITATAAVNPAPPIPTFTITNLTNSYSITCQYPFIDLDATTTYTYNNGTLNYFWASSSATFSTNSVTIVNPGTYTVTGIDPVTNCGITHTIAIGINTAQPVSSVSPVSQLINCNTAAQTITVTSTQSVSITHNILSPLGGTFAATTGTATFIPGTPGTYTYCLVNDINGCQTCKQFTVNSSDGFPTYTLVSPSNYTLGCTTKSVATINIVGGTATSGSLQVPTGAPVSYTIIGPPTSTVTPTGSLSANSTYTVNVPGTWTVIVKDNASFCESKSQFSIIQNTFAPNVSAVVPRQVLDCNVPNITFTAQSITPGVSFLWSFPEAPGNLPGSAITISNNPASPTTSLIANYTLTTTDTSSTCKSTSIIPVYQNLYIPKVTISNGGNSAITCKTPQVELNIQSSTSIPAGNPQFPVSQPVVAVLWQGPSPQEDRVGTTTYPGYTSGTYTLTGKDLNNGCVNTATVFIEDQRDYPSVNPLAPQPLDCGSQTALLKPTYKTPLTDLKFQWYVPQGLGIETGSLTLPSLTVDQVGEYRVVITNTKNGCETELSTSVVAGSLTAAFEADKASGFAPLTVNFDNNSKTTTDTLNSVKPIKAIWNFGNGTTQSFSNTVNTSIVYNLPGTYTVTLYSNKGSCLQSVQKVITVDMPSKLVIPNIFTPNGDGANDLFMLQASNLTEINVVIFDRWGHVVYELASSSGNIAWDGKNQRGVEVAEGVYFYTITAKGKDAMDYTKNGTVTLSR